MNKIEIICFADVSFFSGTCSVLEHLIILTVFDVFDHTDVYHNPPAKRLNWPPSVWIGA